MVAHALVLNALRRSEMKHTACIMPACSMKCLCSTPYGDQR